MGKPVIVALDDDPDVLWAVERDLRKQYASRFRIVRADSGESAIETLKELKMRNDAVALFLVDQRMPHMTGVEFLAAAMDFYPDAKRALLTAYADTDAAIRAINEIKIDYYLLKPWEPPDQQLYPVLDDLLDDWLATFNPAFEGIRVVGYRWSPRSHQAKDFLSRNQIPYQWLDLELTEEARRLVTSAGIDPANLPLVIFKDGSSLADPSVTALAQKAGLKTEATSPFYDLIIVGGGPAGLAAAVYGGSEGLRTVMIEKQAPGGQAGTSSKIENYLGFPSGLSGADLARRAATQAKRFGVEILSPQEVANVIIQDPYRVVCLSNGMQLNCHALLIATGVQYRKLDVPGCDMLTGAGVYYGAALSEAMSHKGEDVFIVGGANSAGQAAMHFSRYARSTTMLIRGPSLESSMSKYLIDQIESVPSIRVVPQTNVIEAHGETKLEALTIQNSQTGETQTLPAAGLFIFIGAKPQTDWLAGLVERDEDGFILAGEDLIRDGRRPRGWMLKRDPFLLETSVPGVFVAGDVRAHSVKRVASAVGEGSMCVQFIHQYLGGM